MSIMGFNPVQWNYASEFENGGHSQRLTMLGVSIAVWNHNEPVDVQLDVFRSENEVAPPYGEIKPGVLSINIQIKATAAAFDTLKQSLIDAVKAVELTPQIRLEVTGLTRAADGFGWYWPEGTALAVDKWSFHIFTPSDPSTRVGRIMDFGIRME
ncbi:hypothetical protein [Haliea sp. E17]|uniref:hypothetical protein n=1 Tax=Haliea sp. E17 TaxID=3401576 RepID=UPI003AAC1B36